PRAPALAVSDEDGLTLTGGDCGRRMPDVEHERAAADLRSVEPLRHDAEVVRDADRRSAGARDPLHLLPSQPPAPHALPRRIRVGPPTRLVRDLAEHRGLGGADDRDLAAHAHVGLPAGLNTGTEMWSSCFWKATSSAMSSTSASGVCATSTRFVIMRGPSS